MSVMATPPESTKISVGQRLRAHAQARWPQAGELEFRYRGAFVYVEANLPDGTVRHPLIFGHHRRWQRCHVHDLTPLPAMFGCVGQRSVTALAPVRIDGDRVLGIIDQTPGYR
jgi:hypothetical protein